MGITLITLKYEDFPKLRQEYKDIIFKSGDGPDFKVWLKREHNATISLRGVIDDNWRPPESINSFAWEIEFENDEDATIFKLKWS